MSVAALVSALSAFAGGVATWVKTREDIRALQVDMRNVKSSITGSADHGEAIARLEVDSENMRVTLASMDKKLDTIQETLFRRR